MILISCSKDADLLRDAVLSETGSFIEEGATEDETTEEEIDAVEDIVEVDIEEDSEEILEELEVRTTGFPPINDAHYQAGKGFDQQIIRLEEGNRTSYLMFDLGAIDSIGGQITSAALQFTISGDDGNGSITVYQGASNDWTEEDLAKTTIPSFGSELGSITKEYAIGTTETITLIASDITAETTTLILDHQNGNDLAFASKENVSTGGPKLIVTYMAPVEAEEIILPFEEQQPAEATSGEENQEPMALADGSPSSGKAPLEVLFSGSNSSDDTEIAKYSWDFKDGTTATEANPKHTFVEIGTYEVTLTVTDNEGLSNTDAVIINVTDEVNQAPVAIMSATPKSGEAPLEVTFNGSQSTDDNNITSFEWDFKDGSSSNTKTPKHIFTKPGTYEVALTVKDENGLFDKKDITITVTEPVNVKPVAFVSANKTFGEAPLTIQFTGDKSSDDKKVNGYSWDFKDGSKSSNANPSNTFTKAGTYSVELTVTDEDGLSDKKAITISVSEPQASNEAPVASSSSNLSSGDAPLQINFKGDQSTDDEEIVSYSWNFKDGSTSNEANPTHTFETPGTYQVEFTVTDTDGATDTDVDTITVTEANSGNTGGNSNYPSNAVFASSFGFKAGDATEAFEAAMESGSSFLVFDKQSTDWVIRPERLFDIHDMTIVFEPGVVLRAKSGAFNDSNANLFQLVRPKNITIEGYGATFRMNKSEYGTSEFRHALAIRKGENITIRGLTLLDSGGDGIFLGGSGSGTYSKNITIEDVITKNNSRQGMSIISAEDVWVRNSEFLSTSGVKPECGVDLEPDYSNERLVNINFINCKFSGNDSHGFMLSTGKLNGSSRPISIVIRDSEFSSNSRSPQNGVTKAEVLIGQGDTNNPVKGEIRFERVTFNGSNDSAIFSRKSAEAFQAVFRDCVAKNVSKNGLSPIELQAHELENTLGGFDFGNFRIEYNSSANFMKINAPSQGGSFRVKDIIGNFIIKEPNDNPIKYSGGYNSSKNINVSIQYQHI